MPGQTPPAWGTSEGWGSLAYNDNRMQVTISGGTGFIGGRVIAQLLPAGVRVNLLTRQLRAGLPQGVAPYLWDPAREAAPAESLAGSEAVIHLMGESVAQCWTPEIKRRIRESRVLSTRNLVDAIAASEARPPMLISASAVGYYGARGDEWLDEKSAPGKDFLAEVCQEWETEAMRASEFGVRVLRLRIGMVLGAEGGALARMLPPFRFGVGGRIGSGEQWMSWIHASDLVGMMLFALRYPHIEGVWNAVSPNPVTNAEFTQTLARILKRPALMPVPEFALKLLFGEGRSVMLASQRVKPAAAEEAGYRFQYGGLHAALRHLLRT
ncbi:MAG: TIGR01777 family oxidoreductase [Bryobacterales bacterium]|nr:TIGR01777 family oxidoreductase [Bryobacterales bacterium]